MNERERREELAKLAERVGQHSSRIAWANPDQAQMLVDEVKRCHELLAWVDHELRGQLMMTGADWGYDYSVRHAVTSTITRHVEKK